MMPGMTSRKPSTNSSICVSTRMLLSMCVNSALSSLHVRRSKACGMSSAASLHLRPAGSQLIDFSLTAAEAVRAHHKASAALVCATLAADQQGLALAASRQLSAAGRLGCSQVAGARAAFCSTGCRLQLMDLLQRWWCISIESSGCQKLCPPWLSQYVAAPGPGK